MEDLKGDYQEQIDKAEGKGDSAKVHKLRKLNKSLSRLLKKYLALTSMEAGAKAAVYLIRTGNLYPGIDWAETF